LNLGSSVKLTAVASYENTPCSIAMAVAEGDAFDGCWNIVKPENAISVFAIKNHRAFQRARKAGKVQLFCNMITAKVRPSP